MEQGRTDREASVADGDVVVLVSEAGEPTGTAPKLTAHVPPGRLHLAFSVVLYRIDGPVLLQQRAGTKYHFPLAWANSCCSHPRPGEDIVDSAERRVAEELGLCCRLTEVGTLTYRASCPDSGLVEHEFDHVLVGTVVGEPVPDPTEVAALRWEEAGEVLANPPANSAPWLVPVLRLAERARAAGLAPPG
ncbi:MAG: isopentenyl-diphosphate Delta-isomerase [Acidimicrobiales bacterium]